MSNKVVIFGTGLFAELVHYYLTNDSDYDVVAFCAHKAHIKDATMFELPVIPYETIQETHPPGDYKMYVGIGYKNLNKLREEVYHDSKSKGYELISYVSSNCNFFAKSIGDNCFIMEDNTVQPFVTIGNNVIMWSGNHIGHHGTIQDHCFLTSHAVVSGNVTLGERSFIGVNATIRDSISIGKENIIGAGAIIMKPTKDKEVYIGPKTNAISKTSDQIGL